MSNLLPIDFAKKEVGYVEGVANANKYSKDLGRPAESWCCDFVVWCYKQAGLLAHVDNTASVIQMHNWAKTNGLLVQTSQVRANDLVTFDWSGTGVPEHIEIAVGWNGATHLIDTVGGNTGNGGNQSNGDGVYFKHRAPSLVYSVIRPKGN